MKKNLSKKGLQFAQDALAFALAQGLLVPGRDIGVAVSGGVDSVALLRWLVWAAEKQNFKLHVLHFDHRLQSASRDFSRFVAHLAGGLHLPFHLGRLNLAKVEKDPAFRAGMKGQALYRLARYQYLKNKTAELGLDTLALAHQADDQVETVLWRLLRGCSPGGLVGIRPRVRLRQANNQKLVVIRPLLHSSKASLMHFLKDLGQDFMEDPTNSQPVYLRNKIRHRLLPFMREGFNPGIDGHLLHLAEAKKREDNLLNALLERFLRQQGLHFQEKSRRGEGSNFNRKSLQRCPQGLRLRLLEKLIRLACGQVANDIKFSHLLEMEKLVFSSHPAVLALPGGWSVRVPPKSESDSFIIEPVAHHSPAPASAPKRVGKKAY